MKNKLIKTSILISLVAGLFFSCHKELENMMNQENIDIREAKSWYETNKPLGLHMKSASFRNGKLQVKPDWQFAYIKSHKDFKTVEVALSTQGRFGFATEECKQAYKKTGDDRYKQSQTRLVIKTENKDNTTIGFFMTLIPDKDYRDKNSFNVFYSSYLKWQKDFSGYVLYHTLKGNYANGWKFLDGKVVKTVKQDDGSGIEIDLKSATTNICVDYFLEQWYQDCTDWYTVHDYWDSYEGTTCEEPYVGTIYLFTDCIYPYEDNGLGGIYIPDNSNIPSYSLLSNAFITVASLSASEVCQMIGGLVWWNYQNTPGYNNACAIRLSYALNQISGYEVPNTEGQTSSGADGKWYFYRVSAITTYLTDKYGSPEKVNLDDILERKGIIWYNTCPWDNATGHVDIWNGYDCLDESYEECEDTYFWELN